MAHQILTVHYDRTDPRLGRFVEHDSRSLAYPISAPEITTPVDVFWPDSAPILDQGQIGGCVGFTGADLLNTDWAAGIRTARHKGEYFTNASGLYFYEQATKLDGIAGTYPPTDTGSTGLGLAKALQSMNYITSYEHAFTWAQFQSAIAVGPVALGTVWTKSMFNPDANGVLTVGSLDQSNIAGGHEWMCRGVSYSRGLALGRNHWNASWDAGTDAQKLPGEFWISIRSLQRLLAAQGDAISFKLPA